MPLPPDAREAAELMDRLERLARMGEQTGRLNPAQWEALRYLARANRFSRTPAALADYLAATRGTVSRTLLVKGLEYDHAIVLDADKLDTKQLYVALTRGSHRLTILSRQPVLRPT